MRTWFKIFDDTNHLLKDTVIEDYRNDVNRTNKVLHSLSEACSFFDLAEPIWLNTNIEDFKAHSKTSFAQDNFLETIEFFFMEMHVIEED